METILELAIDTDVGAKPDIVRSLQLGEVRVDCVNDGRRCAIPALPGAESRELVKAVDSRKRGNGWIDIRRNVRSKAQRSEIVALTDAALGKSC